MVRKIALYVGVFASMSWFAIALGACDSEPLRVEPMLAPEAAEVAREVIDQAHEPADEEREARIDERSDERARDDFTPLEPDAEPPRQPASEPPVAEEQPLTEAIDDAETPHVSLEPGIAAPAPSDLGLSDMVVEIRLTLARQQRVVLESIVALHAALDLPRREHTVRARGTYRAPFATDISPSKPLDAPPIGPSYGSLFETQELDTSSVPFDIDTPSHVVEVPFSIGSFDLGR